MLLNLTGNRKNHQSYGRQGVGGGVGARADVVRLIYFFILSLGHLTVKFTTSTLPGKPQISIKSPSEKTKAPYLLALSTTPGLKIESFCDLRDTTTRGPGSPTPSPSSGHEP